MSITWTVTVRCDVRGCSRKTSAEATLVGQHIEVTLPEDGTLCVVNRITQDSYTKPIRWRRSAIGMFLCFEHAPPEDKP